MDDLKHTCGFVYSFWFTYKKDSVQANHTKPKKKKSTLYLVQTKASELVDFPGVNTPLISGWAIPLTTIIYLC